MLGRGTFVVVACGACLLALGAVLVSHGTDRYLGAGPIPVATAAPGSATVPGPATDAAGTAAPQGTGTQAAQPVDPALFSPGACMAYLPTSGDRHQTVFLDAGHGGLDPGGTGSTQAGAAVEESTVNLAIELDTLAILSAQGYRVVVSRTQNTTVTRLTLGDVDGNLLTAQGVHDDVAARDVCANLAGANVLVGIYMNAGALGSAGCLTAFDPDRPFSGENQRLATMLQDDVLGAMNAQGWQIPDDGAQSDIGLGSAISAADEAYHHLLLLGPAKAGYFSTPSQMPGALIEPLFLTDPFEATIAASTHGQQVIAGALTGAIDQYLTSA
jgi:N-acetylmuramoyl-L-alanine amidase